MANHRMISKNVIETDAFLDLPPAAQMLYIRIGLNADDDGFTDRLKTICRMMGASKSDIKALESAGYIYVFPSGVAVDLYWNMNNSIRKDRKKPTAYQEEMQSLQLVDSGKYVLKPSDNQMSAECQPSDNQMSAQDKISKDKLSKDNIPSNIQTTSSLDIAKPVDNSVGNAEPETAKQQPASLDGMDLYLLESPAAFNLFRAEYPRKQGALRDVQTAWVVAVAGGAAPGDLVMAARKYASQCKKEKTEPKYIAMPQNFLKDKWRAYIPEYSPGCPHCHGQGVYEKDGGMILCDCNRRYL